MKIDNGKITLLLGGLTLILFSSKPYLLDLIAPAKSIGQVIGENAKDLIDGLNGKSVTTKNTTREIFSNILTILAFTLLALTLVQAVRSYALKANKWKVIMGVILAVLGLILYFAHIYIGLMILLILVPAVVIVAFNLEV